MKTSITSKKIWHIAYPIILGSIAQNIITVTDTAFLGRVSETALGAVAIAGLLYIVFTMLAWGFSVGIQIVIARRYGERNYSRIGISFEHGLGFIILLSIILFLSLRFNTSILLSSLVKSDSVYKASSEYLNIRSFGIFFACINYLFRGLYIGITKTKVISTTTIFMAIVNITLDYILIFGKFGAPAMGIEGAALASLIAEICAMVFFVGYTLLKLPLKHYNMFRFKIFDFQLLKNLINISIPTMIQSFLSLGCWFIFFIFVENLGERPLASSNIIRSIYMLVGLPVWAYGAAANTLTSQLLGAQRKDEVMPMLWKVVKLSVLSVFVFVCILLLFPFEAISIYTDNKELANYSLISLYVVSGTALIFGFSMTFFQAISGTGNTFKALIIEFFVLSIYVLYSWFLAVYLKLEIHIVWTAEYCYAILLGIVSYLYMRNANWMNKKA
jgi:putative MATE family efflux protein